MSANARIPIDLNDSKILLTEALKVLLEFIAEVQQKIADRTRKIGILKNVKD